MLCGNIAVLTACAPEDHAVYYSKNKYNKNQEAVGCSVQKICRHADIALKLDNVPVLMFVAFKWDGQCLAP